MSSGIASLRLWQRGIIIPGYRKVIFQTAFNISVFCIVICIPAHTTPATEKKSCCLQNLATFLPECKKYFTRRKVYRKKATHTANHFFLFLQRQYKCDKQRLITA